jgi:hypothetical protein
MPLSPGRCRPAWLYWWLYNQAASYLIRNLGIRDAARVGWDKKTAARLAEERLVEWRRRGYEEWRGLLDDSERREVVGDDGTRYSVHSTAIDDGDGRVRMMVCVDDGGWSAFVPLCRDEIMYPDGTFVE